ncbi:MAG: hypothetical protein IJU23_08565 [Proteobacteria bacterium]|nr:hypothetical protein [Pseudomonadota bacterium]
MAKRTLVMFSAMALAAGFVFSACSDSDTRDYNMDCQNDVCNCVGNGASCNPQSGIAVYCENSFVTKHVRCADVSKCTGLNFSGCEGEEYTNDADNKNPL